MYLYWNKENILIWLTLHERCIRPITNWRNIPYSQSKKKNKQRDWLIFIACHIFERFRNFRSYCDDRKVHELFLTECLYNYFLAALGYVSCSNQIAALGYVSHTNHITTFWYHAPIIAFGYCFLVNNVMESGGFA